MDFTALVKELGIDTLPEEERGPIMEQLLASLQTRVGLRLSEIISPKQMEHIQKVNDEQGQEAGLKELERAYPDYMKIYQEEIDKMKDRMKEMLPQ